MAPTSDVIAEPSAATEAAPLSLADMSETDRGEYLKTGKLPNETSSAAPDGAAKSGAASEPADKTTQDPPVKETRNDKRYRQLAEENKRLKDELGKRQAVNPGSESPTPKQITKQATAEAKKEILLKDYEDYAEYEKALRADIALRIREGVADALNAEREARNTAEKQTALQKQTETRAELYRERSEKYAETLTDEENDLKECFSDVAGLIGDNRALFPVADVLLDSEVGPQLIKHFGNDLDGFKALLAKGANAAILEIGRLEEKVKPAPTRTATAAKRRSADVGGRGSGSDPVLAAAERGDTAEYIRLMNEREGRSRK